MVGLPDGEKTFDDVCNRLGTIPACDRRTDEWTDGWTSCHAMYASCSKNHTSLVYLVLQIPYGICF